MEVVFHHPVQKYEIQFKILLHNFKHLLHYSWISTENTEFPIMGKKDGFALFAKPSYYKDAR